MAQKCRVCDSVESFTLTNEIESNSDGTKRRYWVECKSCGADGAMLYTLDEEGEPTAVTYEGELSDPVAREPGEIRTSLPSANLSIVDDGEGMGDPDAHYGSVTHPNNKSDSLADL